MGKTTSFKLRFEVLTCISELASDLKNLTTIFIVKPYHSSHHQFGPTLFLQMPRQTAQQKDSQRLFTALAKPDSPQRVSFEDKANKRSWTLDSNVHLAEGGFGRIFIVHSNEESNANLPSGKHVIKIEPLANGPLFCELNFFHRAAKPTDIKNWAAKTKNSHVGVPHFSGFGVGELESCKFRFLVIPYYENSLYNYFLVKNNQINSAEFIKMARSLIQTLRYIHEQKFTHGDIKPENIMINKDLKTPYLVDYGLSARFEIDGKHNEYVYEKKSQNNGTAKYCPRDSHEGFKLSRRSDIEMLAYSLLECQVKKLPWTDSIQDLDIVLTQKKSLFGQPRKHLAPFSSALNGLDDNLVDFFERIENLKYQDVPDYEKYFSMPMESTQNIRLTKISKTSTMAQKSKTTENIVKTTKKTQKLSEKKENIETISEKNSNAIKGLPKVYRLPINNENTKTNEEVEEPNGIKKITFGTPKNIFKHKYSTRSNRR